MLILTKEQRKALRKLYSRLESPPSYRQFRRGVLPAFDRSGCVMVRFCSMWVGVERDGYTHS